MVKENGSSPMLIAAIVGGGAFLLGLVIGLVVFGWWLWPVQWTDASPQFLSESYRTEYVLLVADSFVLTGDSAKAQERIDQLGSQAREALDTALKNTTGIENLRVSQLLTVVRVEAPGGGGPGSTGGATGVMAIWRSVLPICAAVLLLLVVLGGGIFLYMRLAGGTGRGKAPARPGPTVQQGSMATRVETPPEIAAEAGTEPVRS